RCSALHELREGAIRVRREQADHLLVERQHLNLDRAGCQTYGDVVAAQRSITHRNGILRYKSARSEEHTSELQSRGHLVCRLLLVPATTDISTLSLHDALPISLLGSARAA